MKLKLYTSMLTIVLCLGLALEANANCDTCSVPWGPWQTLELTGETILNKPSGCTYTFVYQYRTRDCYGETQVDIGSLFYWPESSGCNLNNFGDCYYSTRAGRRALANHLGPITLSREGACYANIKIDPPQDWMDCAIDPREIPNPGDIEWTARIKCDSNSCCKVQLTPDGTGLVMQDVISSTGCDGEVPELPDFIKWYCMDDLYLIPVDPDQPEPECEPTCDNEGPSILAKVVGNIGGTALTGSFSGLEIYPNPAENEITVEFEETSGLNTSLCIYNVQGQLLHRVSVGEHEKSVTVSIKDLPPGQYICVQMSSDDEIGRQIFQKLK